MKVIKRNKKVQCYNIYQRNFGSTLTNENLAGISVFDTKRDYYVSFIV